MVTLCGSSFFPFCSFLHVDEFSGAIFPLFSMVRQRVLTNNKCFFSSGWCLAFALYLTELRQKESISQTNIRVFAGLQFPNLYTTIF